MSCSPSDLGGGVGAVQCALGPLANGTTYAGSIIGPSLSAGTGAGFAVSGTSLTAGSIYYNGASGLALAKADALSTAGAYCIAISTTECAYNGSFRFSGSQSWTAGQVIYVSASSAGALVTTAPSTSGQFVVQVGFATANDTLDIVPADPVPAVLAVSKGGTGLATLAAHALYVGNGTSAPTAIGLGTSTTVLHGAAAGDPSYSSVVSADLNITTSTCTAGTVITAISATGVGTCSNPAVTITTGTTATLSTPYTFNQEATAGTAVAYTLPTASAGAQYCFANSYNGSAANTGVLTINASASGQFIIFTDGTLSATGGNVTTGGAARDAGCMVGVDSTHWMLFVNSGTFTKH